MILLFWDYLIDLPSSLECMCSDSCDIEYKQTLTQFIHNVSTHVRVLCKELHEMCKPPMQKLFLTLHHKIIRWLENSAKNLPCGCSERRYTIHKDETKTLCQIKVLFCQGLVNIVLWRRIIFSSHHIVVSEIGLNKHRTE